MGGSSLPLKLAFSVALSFSLTPIASSPSSLSSPPKTPSFPALKSSSSSARPPPPSPRAFIAHLLALLGPPQDAARVLAAEAREIRSCLRFLVPFSSHALVEDGRICQRRYADDMVWWPPEPVLELARIA